MNFDLQAVAPECINNSYDVFWIHYALFSTSLIVLLAVLCFCVAVNFFIRAAWLIGLVLTGLSYVAPMTVWKYYKQLNIFQEKQIPNEVVDELIQEQQQRWIETLENSKLKPDTVKRLITNVKESA